MIINLEHGGAGVYLLTKGGKIIYVGRSDHVPSRLAGHKQKEYESVEIIFCSIKESIELERKLIEKHNPPLNIQFKLKAKPFKMPKVDYASANKAKHNVGCIPKAMAEALRKDAQHFRKHLDSVTEAAVGLFLSLSEADRGKLLERFPNKIFGRPL